MRPSTGSTQGSGTTSRRPCSSPCTTSGSSSTRICSGPSARRARSESMTAVDHTSAPVARWVYRFNDADPEAVALLGGKGAGLARMSRAGLPVPPGFIITTRACAEYVAMGKLPAGVTEAVRAQVAALEDETKRSFGGGPVPLLVSVRSGAPVSMPGMMETILNLGIGRDAAVALAEATRDPEFVLDVTRRLQKGFSEVVLGADPDVVDEAVADFPLRADGAPFGETFDRYWALCRQAVQDDVGAAVPENAWDQLQAAVMAVLHSWTSRRAVTYREHHNISPDMGTAVVIQSMVFGNLGSPSGAGVAFTRNPVTGERALYGEFLEGGQGEDLVAGIGASPGQVTGSLVLDSERAVEWAQADKELILARPSTSPRDLQGLIAAAAVVTARGGAPRHSPLLAPAPP